MARGLRGVRADLSELLRSIVDVTCFLGPLLAAAAARQSDSPPPSPRPRSRVLRGVLNDLAEIGGSFRAGLSRLSGGIPNRKAGSDEGGDADGGVGDDGAVDDDGVGLKGSMGVCGVSEDVIEFVGDLVACPDSWLEFPVPLDDEFDISPPQREHMTTVEKLVPSLAVLRMNLCPTYMSEESFWKIYFALLHPSLSKHDSDILSTQQIVEAMRLRQKEIQSSLNTLIRSSRLETSDVAISSGEVNNRAQENTLISPQTLEADIDQPLTHSYLDASYGPRKHYKSSEDDISWSDMEEDGRLILLNKYMNSLSPEELSIPQSRSVGNWARSRKRFYSGGPSKTTAHKFHKKSVDEGSSDWQNVEDSDFEIVERLS